MTTDPAILALDKVTVRFGGVVALSEVSLALAPGEALGVIGPNGSGKTTLIDAVSGTVRALGDIRFDGVPIGRLGAFRRARLGIRRSFQTMALFDGMSVLDNIRVAAEHTGADGGEGESALQRARALIEATGLGPYAAENAGTLSTGYRKRAEIARALAGRPKLLLLDEPTAGVLPADADAIIAMIGALRRAEGFAVVLVEHYMPAVTALCDRVIVLDCGQIIADGSPDAVRDAPQVRDAYLGAAE